MGFELSSLIPESIENVIETIKEFGDGIKLELFGPSELTEITENIESDDDVYGEPGKDAANWHLQEQDMSCAVACQEFIAEQITGKEFTEAEMTAYAQEQGWYDPETGTYLDDTGKLLEAIGIDVERSYNNDINDLAQALESGEKVICGVNNNIIVNPAYANMPGMNVNHAVQVTGIDNTDPNNVKVILNDPGVVNGQGLVVSAETFVKAWNTGNNFAVFAKN